MKTQITKTHRNLGTMRTVAAIITNGIRRKVIETLKEEHVRNYLHFEGKNYKNIESAKKDALVSFSPTLSEIEFGIKWTKNVKRDSLYI